MRDLPRREKHLSGMFLRYKSKETGPGMLTVRSQPPSAVCSASHMWNSAHSAGDWMVFIIWRWAWPLFQPSDPVNLLWSPPPTSCCLGLQEMLLNPFPSLQWINVSVVCSPQPLFQTEPAFGWKHKTPNLAGAVQRAQDAGGSGGVLIPTFEASSYSGNYILLQKSVPAAAGRYSLHFHLSKRSWEIRSLWRWLADPGGGFVQGTAAFQHWPSWAVSPGVCWAVCKELCLKKLYICKVLLSPHLFQSSTPVTVMRNQPQVPQSFSLVQA